MMRIRVLACGDMKYLESFFGHQGFCLLCDCAAGSKGTVDERGKCFVLYVSQEGDSLSSLAARHHVPVWLLQRINGWMETGPGTSSEQYHLFHDDFNLRMGEAHTLHRNQIMKTAALDEADNGVPFVFQDECFSDVLGNPDNESSLSLQSTRSLLRIVTRPKWLAPNRVLGALLACVSLRTSSRLPEGARRRRSHRSQRARNDKS